MPSPSFLPSFFSRLLALRPRCAPAAWWRACLAALLLACAVMPAGAAEIELTRAKLESTDDGYRLEVAYAFDLNHGLEDALMRGVPLYFTTDLQLTRKRWYWLDETAISQSRTIRLSYNVLTRQFHAAVTGQLQQSFATLEDALSLVRRPSRWIIADKGALKSDEIYTVSLRMHLDVAQLPKPFQVNALNNSDWRFSSDWKEFAFKPE